MAPYCGRVVKVYKSVSKIIDEPTGKMLHMKQPCIMLDGVVCKAEYASCRLNCPRVIPSYWREIWLERVEDNQWSTVEPTSLQGVALNAGGHIVSTKLCCILPWHLQDAIMSQW